jgi:hypothetical protein
LYAYCIGQCGIKPDEYWRLSEAETIGIIAGHQILESYDAEKFRNIYGVMIKYMGEKGDVKKFWPLPTDGLGAVTKEYLDKRNADAIEIAKQLGIMGDC